MCLAYGKLKRGGGLTQNRPIIKNNSNNNANNNAHVNSKNFFVPPYVQKNNFGTLMKSLPNNLYDQYKKLLDLVQCDPVVSNIQKLRTFVEKNSFYFRQNTKSNKIPNRFTPLRDTMSPRVKFAEDLPVKNQKYFLRSDKHQFKQKQVAAAVCPHTRKLTLPIVDLCFEDKEVKFLIDTGSAYSIVNSVVLGKNHAPLQTDDLPSLVAVNGTQITVQGRIPARICIGGMHIHHDFLVADIGHNIVGYDLLNKESIAVVSNANGVFMFKLLGSYPTETHLASVVETKKPVMLFNQPPLVDNNSLVNSLNDHDPVVVPSVLPAAYVTSTEVARKHRSTQINEIAKTVANVAEDIPRQQAPMPFHFNRRGDLQYSGRDTIIKNKQVTLY